uniref:Myoneurin [Falco cherrug] n=1 Tax=Lepeophtheirus salmonis TaxID=72036 RepID=A0A0K2UQU9_LEPSM
MIPKSFNLKWSSHFPNMEKVFANLVKSESLADVTLYTANGQMFRAHRFVLSSCSDFLRNVFLENPSEQPVVHLPEVESETIKLLLDFIYTGELLVDDDVLLMKIMDTSNMLFIKGIHSALEEKQKKNNSTMLNVETIGNKRKTRSPRQYISSSPPTNGLVTEEEPRDLSSRKIHNESDILKDRKENLSNIMEEGALCNNDYEVPNPSKLMCLDESVGQAWASNHQVFSSLLSKVEADPLHISAVPRVKQEQMQPPFPQHPPVNLTTDHINNILNTSSLPICPLCGKDCANFPNLRTHLQTHNNSKPFACDFCDSKFTRASHLNRHRRSHTGEKPFECSICGKLFGRQDKLKVHVDRHRIREQKELKAANGGVGARQTMSQQNKGSNLQPQQHHTNNWNVNATFPSQVSPFPTYYDTIPKTQHNTLMPSFMG